MYTFRLGKAPGYDGLDIEKPTAYQPPPVDQTTNGGGNGGNGGSTTPLYAYKTLSDGGVQAIPLNDVAKTTPPPPADNRGGYYWYKAPFGMASNYWQWRALPNTVGPQVEIPPAAAGATVVTEGGTTAVPFYVPPGVDASAFAPPVQQAGINPWLIGGIFAALILGKKLL